MNNRDLLAQVATWGYQLQNLNVVEAARSIYDVLVVDYSEDGSEQRALSPGAVKALHERPDGDRRLVLCYLSIGEAENYRHYWCKAWNHRKPSFVLNENPEWPGNYAVEFWHKEWKNTIFGSPGAYLDRIIRAGFSGVYLDKADVIGDDVWPSGNYESRRRAMIEFIRELSAYARAHNPDFLIIMQNAEDLLTDAKLVAALDGVAREEFTYGVDAPGVRNSASEIRDSAENMLLAEKAGKRVMIVEYLNDIDKIKDAAAVARGYFPNCLFYISDQNRSLNKLGRGK